MGIGTSPAYGAGWNVEVQGACFTSGGGNLPKRSLEEDHTESTYLRSYPAHQRLPRGRSPERGAVMPRQRSSLRAACAPRLVHVIVSELAGPKR